MQWANEHSHGRVTVRPLDPRSERALRDWLERARQAGIDVSDLASIAAAYDAYVDQVRATPADRRGDPTLRLTTIAMAMGEYLQARSPLTWSVAEDSEGTDLALRSTAGLGVLFPIDPVADAWSRQERGWLPGFVDGVLAELVADES